MCPRQRYYIGVRNRLIISSKQLIIFEMLYINRNNHKGRNLEFMQEVFDSARIRDACSLDK
jgi:hypothetical protein